MEPLLSVCLITYNHKDFIRGAIEGVLMQQVNFSFELIIADDYSTDGTREILLQYQQKYPSLIKLILQEKNVGAAQNWIDLITAPKTKYIAYFEGDDYWIDPEKLQKQVDFLELNGEYSFTFHQGLKINELTSQYEVYPLSDIRSFDADSFLKMPTIPMASLVYRSNVPLKIFKSHSHGDFLMLCSLLSHGKAWFINEVMSVYRVHPSGVSYTHSSLPYVKKRLDELYIESNVSEFSEEVQKQIARIYMEHTIFMLTNYKKEIPRAERLGYLFRFMKLKKPGMNHWPYYKKLLGQILSSLVITLFIQ